jgi:molybdopterin adenylyltransferase
MKILSVNISEEKGTTKHPVPGITLNEKGINEDAHAGTWHRQISLLSKESIDKFSASSGKTFKFGDFAENITTEGVDLVSLPIFTQLQIGNALMEVTQIGKKCHGEGCAIYREVGECVMPKEGIFCRVINGGILKAGDKIKVIKKTLNVHIITLSDRASAGEYPDKSGPEIKRLLENHFSKTSFSANFANVLISDDENLLRNTIKKSLSDDCDLLITTGGTGLAKRDITPDIIKPMLDKEIPGIMEFIRVKYGEIIPSALLSRSVAGIIGNTLIFTLPGSQKAVTEYIFEISKILNHAVLSIRGIEGH